MVDQLWSKYIIWLCITFCRNPQKNTAGCSHSLSVREQKVSDCVGVFLKMLQDTEIMLQNSCSTHLQQNDSFHLHISISIRLSKS